MDEHLYRVQAWLDTDSAEGNEIDEDVRLLDEYYSGPLWREDFEANEEDAFPPDFPCGVLSENAVYDVLMEYEERLKERVRGEGNI